MAAIARSSTNVAARPTKGRKGQGGGSAPPPSDVTPPVISGVSSTPTGPTLGSVNFSVDEAGTGRVAWNSSAEHAATPGVFQHTTPTIVTSSTQENSVILEGLPDGDTIHYDIVVDDLIGNSQRSWVQLGDLTFVTPEIGPELTDTLLGTRTVEGNIVGASVVWPYTGDPDDNVTATMKFKIAGEPDATWVDGVGGWRDHIDGQMWKFQLPSFNYRAMHASIIDAIPNTTYDVRVFWDDPGAGSETHDFQVTTSADIDTEAAVTYDRYVDALAGNDANDGLTSGTAWKTLGKAWNVTGGAPSGAKVRLGPGFYWIPTNVTRSAPIQLFAQYKAVTYDAGAKTWTKHANAAQLTFIIPSNTNVVGANAIGTLPCVSAPAGTAAGYSYITDSRGGGLGNWESVTLNGHQVWKWAGSPTLNVSTMMWSATQTGTPTRIGHWNYDASQLTTPTAWATVLRTNLTFNYGNYAQSASNDVYVRLPGDVDPNTVWITMGSKSQAGFNVNQPDCRLSGVVMRGFHYAAYIGSTSVTNAAHRAVIDHCLFQNNYAGLALQGRDTTVDSYSTDALIEKNICEDSNLWAIPNTTAQLPWKFVKQSITLAGGTSYSTTRVGGDQETSFIYGRGWARRVTARWNLVDGAFNGFSMGDNGGYDEKSLMNSDFYENEVINCPDDPFEPDFAAINVRFFRNRTSNTFTFISVGPGKFGPIYAFENEIHQISSEGVKLSYGESTAYSCYAIKYSQKNSESGTDNVRPPRVYFFNNTVWSNWPTADFASKADAGGVNANYMTRLWLRNNLVRAGRYAADVRHYSGWDEDYNHFSTSDTGRGLLYPQIQNDGTTNGPGTIYKTNVAAYRTDYTARSGRTNANTNTEGDFITASVLDNALEDPANRDLRLKSGSVFLASGMVIGGSSDTIVGRAPHMGYQP